MIGRAALVLALTTLAGCGQTGPLYLPDEGTTTPVEIRPIGAATGTPAATATPANAAPAATPASDAPGTDAGAPSARDDAKKPSAAPQAATPASPPTR